MNSNDLKNQIQAHWTRRTDTAVLEGKLEKASDNDRGRLLETLAPHDHLHAGLLESTRLLASWAGLPPGSRVLDIGAGLGGTARFLADTLQCRVTAVDVTPKLHDAAHALTKKLGLADRVEHLCCDIMELGGFEPYDVVLLQHVDMQIEDKVGLYGCAGSCCSKDGAVIWHDWLTDGDTDKAPAYPVMWSKDGSLSFLSSPKTFRQDLARTGLELVAFEEIGEQTKTWFETAADRLDSFLSKLRSSNGGSQARRQGAEDLLEEVTNTLRNIEDRTLVPFFALARKK